MKSVRRYLLPILILIPGAILGYTEGTNLTVLQTNEPARDFTLTASDGSTHRLSEYRGSVVIVNFWATWCPPCLEEMPAMQRAWETIQNEGMVMLGINLGEDEDTVFEFTASYPVDFPLLLDLDAAVSQDWPVTVLPTTYIVDPYGNLVFRAIGARAWDAPELLDKLRALHKQ